MVRRYLLGSYGCWLNTFQNNDGAKRRKLFAWCTTSI